MQTAWHSLILRVIITYVYVSQNSGVDALVMKIGRMFPTLRWAGWWQDNPWRADVVLAFIVAVVEIIGTHFVGQHQSDHRALDALAACIACGRCGGACFLPSVSRLGTHLRPGNNPSLRDSGLPEGAKLPDYDHCFLCGGDAGSPGQSSLQNLCCFHGCHTCLEANLHRPPPGFLGWQGGC
jgi:hypothetical protein